MPATGGIKTSARLLRPVVDPGVADSASPLDKHILRLLNLHQDVSVKFRSIDLGQMDDATEHALLADIQDLLKIVRAPFPAT